MKKLTFILAATAVIALASCSKEKDCTCVQSFSGTGSELMTPIADAKATIEDGDCEDLNTEVSANGFSTKLTCTED